MLYVFLFFQVWQYTHLKGNSEKGDQETLKWAYIEERFCANFETIIVLDLEELNTTSPSCDISKRTEKFK